MTNEEAIARIREHKIIHKMNEPRAIYISEALDMAIKALEQQPKAGKWLIAPDEEPGYDIAGIKTWYKIATCSECGFIKPMIEYHIGQYKYCPNCGTKMQEVEE